jgi:hypothetical protein
LEAVSTCLITTRLIRLPRGELANVFQPTVLPVNSPASADAVVRLALGLARRVVIHNRLDNTLSSHGCEAVFAAMALESLGVQGPSFMAFTGHSQFFLSSSRENKLVSPVTRIDVGRSRGADNGAICSRSHLPVPNRAPLAGRGRSSTHEATLIEVARGSLTRPGALLIAADEVPGFAGACLMQTPYWLPSSHWQFLPADPTTGLRGRHSEGRLSTYRAATTDVAPELIRSRHRSRSCDERQTDA